MIKSTNRGIIGERPTRVIGGLYQWDINVSGLAKDSFWSLFPRYVSLLVYGVGGLEGSDPVLYLEENTRWGATYAAMAVLNGYNLL